MTYLCREVDGEQAVAARVQFLQYALGYRGLAGTHGSHQQYGTLGQEQVVDQEVVAEGVHRGH